MTSFTFFFDPVRLAAFLSFAQIWNFCGSLRVGGHCYEFWTTRKKDAPSQISCFAHNLNHLPIFRSLSRVLSRVLLFILIWFGFYFSVKAETDLFQGGASDALFGLQFPWWKEIKYDNFLSTEKNIFEKEPLILMATSVDFVRSLKNIS